jgi:hypothetical protein
VATFFGLVAAEKLPALSGPVSVVPKPSEWRDTIWTTMDGRRIPIKEMADDHVVNCIWYFERMHRKCCHDSVYYLSIGREELADIRTRQADKAKTNRDKFIGEAAYRNVLWQDGSRPYVEYSD